MCNYVIVKKKTGKREEGDVFIKSLSILCRLYHCYYVVICVQCSALLTVWKNFQ